VSARFNRAHLQVERQQPGLALDDMMAVHAATHRRRGSVADEAQIARFYEYCRRWQWGLAVAARDICTALRALALPFVISVPFSKRARTASAKPGVGGGGGGGGGGEEGEGRGERSGSGKRRSTLALLDDTQAMLWFEPARLAVVDSRESREVEVSAVRYAWRMAADLTRFTSGGNA
jgi:hypothetical protein